jgi:cytochrome c551/c552
LSRQNSSTPLTLKDFTDINEDVRCAVIFLFAAAMAHGQAPSSLTSQRAILDQYCVTCHNQKLKTAGLMLDKLDLAQVGEHAEQWEKVVRKLRAGMMPPAGLPRPNAAAYEALTVALENELDRAAASHPHLPAPAIHRVNRTEYTNAIRSLLALDVDAAAFLPADDSSYGFDNVVSGLGVSPALVEGYVEAASKISRLALGHETAPSRKVYHVREDYSQEEHIEGLPFGTRGGMLIHHYFPADGEYAISWDPVRTTVGGLYGGDSEDEQAEVLIDGARVKVFRIGKDVPIASLRDKNEVRVPVKAGRRTVGVTFSATTYVPNVDLNRHYRRSILDDNLIDGFTFTPQVSSVTISGPYNGARPQSTPSRDKIFICTPSGGSSELPCARKILTALAREAYRRPITDSDSESFMTQYQAGRNGGDFEDGIERGLQFILAHPEFVFRAEDGPANVKPGQAYRISDMELASRLAFFFWSSGPDDELIRVAAQGKLRNSGVLEQQIRRMLTDQRTHELVKNFAGQWLQLRVMQSSTPEGIDYPDFDDNLRQAFRTEAEMFFESIVREDRSIIDLLNGDYTFVNERLAVHYGIPNVYGSQFRRVKLDGALDVRRGLLGKGGIELVTSVSDRTSPVQRGKWVMTNILGVVPPDPPPNVPALKETAAGGAGPLTLRQQMEAHRANPACAACHKMMDPIGFAMENFDGIGKWRTKDAGQNVNASGQLTDGTKISGVVDLRNALLRYSPQFARTVTEKLLTYALGRGVEYQDMPVVRAIVRDAARNDYRFSALIEGIVNSEPFQMNRKPEAPFRAANVRE